MRDVYDYAKFFVKNGADSIPDTYDGNMKLQKLLVLADLAHIAEYGEPLFEEEVLAFQNGCVVEKVRLRYKNDYRGLKQDSDRFESDFTQEEYEILNMVMDIFGNASARELSEINHTFTFWKEAYRKGTDANGFHDKRKSVVDIEGQAGDIEKMREILNAYRESSTEATASETINGVTFFYDGFELTEERIEQLERFAMEAEDEAYSVYLDGGRLVIY